VFQLLSAAEYPQLYFCYLTRDLLSYYPAVSTRLPFCNFVATIEEGILLTFLVPERLVGVEIFLFLVPALNPLELTLINLSEIVTFWF
jgi:hypothetical protein